MSTTTNFRPTISSLIPSSTAQVITGYVPPLATGTTFIPSTHRTFIPTGTESQTVVITAFPAEPTTPNFADNVSYVFAYLVVHSLSMTSQRYTYILWILVGGICLIMAALHWFGMRGGYLGALWSKWALRRRTWRKKHALTNALKTGKGFKQPEALPSNAQILTMTVLTIVVLVLCTVGPDYINPNIGIFTPTYNHDARNAVTVFPKAPISTQNSNQNQSTPTATLVRFFKRAYAFDPNVILRFFAPQYTIPKAIWTSAARFGDFAFALLPLCVLFALKAPPFAILALPLMSQIYFDKLVRLHRWTAHLIWFLVAVHVALWSVQLARDKRAATDKRLWAFAFEYDKFRYGWTAFIALTVINVISIRSFRQQHYEIFYVLHTLLVPVILFFSAFHHPPVFWWCWIALGLWVFERMYRFVWWLYVNGFTKSVCGYRPDKHRKATTPQLPQSPSTIFDNEALTKYPLNSPVHGADNGLLRKSHEQQQQQQLQQNQQQQFPGRLSRDKRPMSTDSNATVGGPHSSTPWRASELPGTVEAWEMLDYLKSPTSPTALDMEREREMMAGAYEEVGKGQGGVHSLNSPSTLDVSSPTLNQHQHQQYLQQPAVGSLSQQVTPTSPLPYTPSVLTSNNNNVQSSAIPEPYLPPPGYAHCVLLPGRTIRIRLATPGPIPWAPGQHFLLNIPSIHRATSHPFSVANVYDEQSPSPAGRAMVLLVRARSGWTKKFWERVSQMVAHNQVAPASELTRMPIGWEQPPQGTGGVVMRAYVDGPFGSAARTRWGSYGTVLIVAGGSGVSFAVSVLEYVSLCLAGRNGKFLGGNVSGRSKGRFITNRIRFVWMVREYSHIQWCASQIRRCMSLLGEDVLEVSIYVSNFNIPKEKYFFSMEFDNDQLAPPNPHFAKKGRRGSFLSVDSEDSSGISDAERSDVDLSYAKGGRNGNTDNSRHGYPDHHQQTDDPHDLGHESHVLDYTNFDGEDDTVMPGENNFSRKLKKLGTLRRAKTKRESRMGGAMGEKAGGKRISTVSSDVVIRPGMATRPLSYMSSDDEHTPVTTASLMRESENVFEASFKRGNAGAGGGGKHSQLQPPNAFALRSPGGDTDSLASSRVPSTFDLGYTTGRVSTSTSNPLIVPGEAPGVMIDPIERKDLSIVAEVANPGKPKLDRVLAQEIAIAKGPIVVACCGPTSLNAVMRKVIAAQIDPNRIRKGDRCSSIEFVAEDFEY